MRMQKHLPRKRFGQNFLVATDIVAAIVAAIALTMRKRPGLKVQDVARQVAVRREDRVRLVKMDAEKHP